MTEKYQARKGEEFEIEYKRTITANAHPWYLFEVRQGGGQSTRAILAREIDLIIMKTWDDYSNDALYALVFLRLQIALEKAEPDDPINQQLRPDANFHHALRLPDGVRSMADAMATLKAELETARQPPPIAGFGG